MTECLVNDTPWTVDFRPETWGDLLERLDRALNAERRVVTAVRFDGVDAPSFRSPAQTGRPLAAVARVDVEAEAAGRLLEQSLAVAADSLAELGAAARLTAAAYRAADPDAPVRLATLVGAVQSLVALTQASATAARVSQECWDADAAVSAACRGMEAALVGLIDRHAGSDWEGVAAALDAELAPAVVGWRDVLEAIAKGQASCA